MGDERLVEVERATDQQQRRCNQHRNRWPAAAFKFTQNDATSIALVIRERFIAASSRRHPNYESIRSVE